jgi:hypothetical protein
VEAILLQVGRTAALLIEAAAVLVVTFGASDAFLKLVSFIANPAAGQGARRAIWRRSSLRL